MGTSLEEKDLRESAFSRSVKNRTDALLNAGFMEKRKKIGQGFLYRNFSRKMI